MKNYMEWIPRIENGNGSWARRLADAIAADISSGRLASGDQLPTQRSLAQQLGITTGTVNRGYAIAERAGLISAEVGRGTFVTGASGNAIHESIIHREETGAINFALNYPTCNDAEIAIKSTLSNMIKRDEFSGLLSISSYAGLLQHRAAGAIFLRQLGVLVSADEVILCTSVQHGLAATLSAITVPGDVVLTESLTSPGIKALAASMQLQLVGVDCDDNGILPDELERASRNTHAKVIYTMPTLHTPTTITMPESRRHEIAEVLRRNELIAIEDDAWGFLAEGSIKPLHTFAPECVVYLTSCSKSLAPGLRIGFIVAPPSIQRAVTSCIGTITWASPLLAEIVKKWIEDGTAKSIIQQRIRTANERQQLAKKLLGASLRSGTSGLFPSFHLWLLLPEPWRADEFSEHAETLGVSLGATSGFVPGRAHTPHAVRICTGTEMNVNRVEEGLRIIVGMLKSGPRGYSVPSF